MKSSILPVFRKIACAILAIFFAASISHAYLWHIDTWTVGVIYHCWNDDVPFSYQVTADESVPSGTYYLRLLHNGSPDGYLTLTVNDDRSVGVSLGYGYYQLEQPGSQTLAGKGTVTEEADGNLYQAINPAVIAGTAVGKLSAYWSQGTTTVNESCTTTHHTNVLAIAISCKCPDGTEAVPAAVNAAVKSLHAAFGLGVGTNYQGAGRLSIEADIANTNIAIIDTTNLSTPRALRVGFGGLYGQVTDSNGLRQVLSGDVLADIVTSNRFQYDIRYYMAANAGTTNAAGVYQPIGNPFKAVTVQNPDGTNGYNRFWITCVEGTITNQWQYTYTASTNALTAAHSHTWQLLYPSNLKKEVVTTSWETNWTRETITRSVYNPGSPDVLVYQEKTDLVDFGFGPVAVQETIGTGSAALTNTWDYYTNASDAGFTKVRQMIRWDGYWERYEYDGNLRETCRISPFLNAAPTASTNLCRVVTTIYSNAAPNITRIESVLGHEVARTYWAYSGSPRMIQTVQCRTPGASFSDAGNLVTTSLYDYANRPTNVMDLDGTGSFYTYVTNADYGITATMAIGQTNAAGTGIDEGTKTITVVGPSGQMVSNTVINVTGGSDGAALQRDSYNYASDDYAHRSPSVLHLDGTTTSGARGCCGAPNYGNVVGKDGTTNYLTYDVLQREIASTVNGVTRSDVLDAYGNVTASLRIGTDSSVITNRLAVYDTAEQLISETDGLNRTTSHDNYVDSSGQFVKASTYPDTNTRVETYFADGQLQSITGTAVPNPVRYEYGVEQDGGVYRLYAKEIKLNVDGSDTSEWTKAYRDGIGNYYKLVYSSASGSPASVAYYNEKGQCTNAVDPDGVSWLYQYNAKNECEYVALDINRNGQIDWAGPDRITRIVRDTTTDNGMDVYRARMYVWPATNSAVSNLIFTAEESVDGLRAWSILWNNGAGITNAAQVTYDAANGYRIETSTAPDGSSTIVTNKYNRLVSITRRDSAGAQIGQTTFGFDPQGRANTVVDARAGTATAYYDNAHNVTSIVAPPPVAGQAAPAWGNYFDAANQISRVAMPDGTSVTNEFTPYGAMARNYGSRVYPAGFGYAAQARLQTMTNWSGFPSSGARVTTWNRDAYRGWVTNKVYDGSAAGPGYTFTSAGRLATRKGARNITTSYSRNNAGEATSLNYSDTTPDVAIVYDRQGRETSVTNGTSTTGFAWNDVGQLLQQTNVTGTLAGLASVNRYNALLFRTNVSVRSSGSNLFSVAYAPDAASRLRVVSNGTNSAAYAYVPNSPRVGQMFFTNGGTLRLTRSNQFDLWNRPTEIVYRAGGSVVASFSYQNNLANQRTRMTLADGSYWLYQYDSLGQVTNATRYWKDATPVAGQQFAYSFDSIGNRISAGRDSRRASYTNNTLNQLTSRDVSGYLNVIGSAHSNATVTLWGTNYLYVPTTRKGEYFRSEVPVANTSGPVWLTITNMAILQTGGTNKDWIATSVGSTFVAQTPESFVHDADGNRVSDGRWTNSWDGENRITNMALLANSPSPVTRKLAFLYDFMGRRVEKLVSTNTHNGWATELDQKFVYDGWRLLTVLDGNNAALYSISWGKDYDGSDIPLFLTVHSGSNAGSYIYILDANHRVMALVNAATAATAGQWDYDPFLGILQATGPLAKVNPLLGTSQSYDWETGLYYCGYRYYDPSAGKWLSRDPIEEFGGRNLYGFVGNNPVNLADPLGLSADETGGPFGAIGPSLVTGAKSAANLIAGWIYPEPAELPDYSKYVIVHNDFGGYDLYPGFDFGPYYLQPIFDPQTMQDVFNVADAAGNLALLLTPYKWSEGTAIKCVEREQESLRFTFRGDSQAPEVIFNQGFSAKGISTDLYAHTLDSSKPLSAFISTSISPDVAAGFANNVYVIRPVNGIDVNQTLGVLSPFPGELEIAIPWKINPKDIRGVTLQQQGFSILNPNWKP